MSPVDMPFIRKVDWSPQTASRPSRASRYRRMGVGPDDAGPNIDPCAFASPLPLIHTFCRLDTAGGKYYVNRRLGASTRKNLAQVATKGDTIIYGHLRTSKGAPVALFVDTILVVAGVRRLPTTPDSKQPRKRFRFIVGEELAAAIGSASASGPAPTWEQLLMSDLWRFNLRDLDEGRGHSHTAYRAHAIIVGAVAAEGEELSALAQRKTSYVPLVDASSESRPLPPHFDKEQSDPSLWRLLTNWLKRNPRLAHGNKPPTELPVKLGQAIYDGTRFRSGWNTSLAGSVALPPLRWTRSPPVDVDARKKASQHCAAPDRRPRGACGAPRGASG
jgi:hypothetical protein